LPLRVPRRRIDAEVVLTSDLIWPPGGAPVSKHAEPFSNRIAESRLQSESYSYCQGRLNRRRDEHALTAPPLDPQDAVAEQPESRIGA
jgi:hypothetical protein